MTNTNKTKKEETFEDKYLEIFGQIDISIKDWEIIKQLHDKKVEEMGNRNIVRMMKEKDKQIEKLQAEIQRLSDLCFEKECKLMDYNKRE